MGDECTLLDVKHGAFGRRLGGACAMVNSAWLRMNRHDSKHDDHGVCVVLHFVCNAGFGNVFFECLLNLSALTKLLGCLLVPCLSMCFDPSQLLWHHHSLLSLRTNCYRAALQSIGLCRPSSRSLTADQPSQSSAIPLTVSLHAGSTPGSSQRLPITAAIA